MLDATGQALSCTNPGCREALLTSEQLRGYDQRASALVLRDGRRATGSVFRFARKSLGLLQSELALLLHVAPETVSRWETEAEPLPRQAQLSLVALLHGVERAQVDIRELVGREQSGRASVPTQLEVLDPEKSRRSLRRVATGRRP